MRATRTEARTQAFLARNWLRGLDSNQDNQLQRLACYQLHYPGGAKESVADIFLFCFHLRAQFLNGPRRTGTPDEGARPAFCRLPPSH